MTKYQLGQPVIVSYLGANLFGIIVGQFERVEGLTNTTEISYRVLIGIDQTVVVGSWAILNVGQKLEGYSALEQLEHYLVPIIHHVSGTYNKWRAKNPKALGWNEASSFFRSLSKKYIK